MTREEAIKGLKVLAKDFSGYRPNEEMFNMAIEALEQLPSAQPEGIKYVELSEEDYEKMAELMRKSPPMLISAQSEIIRCEECKYRRNHSETTAWLPCRALIVPDDFSCIRAERREE